MLESIRRSFYAWMCAQLFAALPAVASADTGSVAGVVTGPDGARLPGVAIALSRDSRVVTEVVSDDAGGFRVSALAPGTYEIRAELSGFRPLTATLVVSERRVANAELRLALAALSEAVVVVGALPRDSVEAPRLAESGARDVGEALAAEPGVAKVRRGAIASDIVVRGYQGENVTVLIDGVRLYGACPNNMDHPAFHVDFAEVDRVEIGKGPFDVRNQGALGGIVNIVTKRPPQGFHATPQLAFGSFGYVNPSATASFGTERFAVLGGYSYRTSGPYDDGAGRSFLAGSNYRASAVDLRAFEVNTGWGRADVQPIEGHSAQITLTRQAAGLVLYPYLQMDADDDHATRVKGEWNSSRAPGVIESWRAEAYGTRVTHSMTDRHRVSSVSSAAGYSMATTARTATLGFKGDAAIRGLALGAEAYARDWSAQTRLAASAYRPQHSIPDTRLTVAGGFAEYSRALSDTLRLDAGGRVDRVHAAADARQANTALYLAYHGISETSAVDVYPTGKVRLSWRLGPQAVVSGGIGRTARVPDPQERYYALARMGTDWVGDPGLRPTTNTGVDAAINWRRPRLFVTATAHRDALGNFVTIVQQARIRAVPGVMNRVARSYANVDATMTGTEAEATFSITNRLFASGSVSATRGRQTPDPASGIQSGNIAEIPPVLARMALRYDLRAAPRGLFGEAEVVHAAMQSRVNADVQETATPAYTIVNLRAGGTYRSLRLTFGIGNLLNRTYVEHLSYQRDPFRLGVKVFEPGRNVYGNAVVAF